MKIGLIIDKGHLRKWQLEALQNTTRDKIALVLNCQNTRNRKKPITNFLYYLLNLFTIQNPQTKSFPVSEHILSRASVIDFHAEYLGQWQKLPEQVIQRIKNEQIDVLIKFGMSLLHVPDVRDFSIPILSYHHGDPGRYRGRPAGFYEMLNREDYMGLVVQKISNDLDAGEIYAYGEARIYNYSYRRTLVAAYRASSFLLDTALRNLAEDKPLNMSANGRKYKLPGNFTVLRFCLVNTVCFVRWVFYGLFYEKKWNVSICQGDGIVKLIEGQSIYQEQKLKIDPEFSFYADPFFLNENVLLFEAMPNKSAKGRIIYAENGNLTALTEADRHHSYPAVVKCEGNVRMLPEIADWGAPEWFVLEKNRVKETIQIKGLEKERLLDSTYFFHRGIHYIFATKSYLESNILHLWYSENIDGPYQEHTSNPICMSPRGARMAGNIFSENGKLYRIGQDFTDKYGNGVFLYEINELSPEHYEESRVTNMRFSKRSGPHTINSLAGTMAFDWYEDRFSLLAGWRRFKARIIKK